MSINCFVSQVRPYLLQVMQLGKQLVKNWRQQTALLVSMDSSSYYRNLHLSDP